MAEEPFPKAYGVALPTRDQLQGWMTPYFLTILAGAARLYAATEDDTGLSLPADLWHFVAWCQTVGGESPERDAQ
jgi:hypothetical protein